jgi:hypothetical protein
VDIFRPSRAGKVATERLPVVWTHHRYRRANVEEGTLLTVVDSFDWLPEVLRHGYVVAAVDARGSGASFGTFTGIQSPGDPGRLRRHRVDRRPAVVQRQRRHVWAVAVTDLEVLGGEVLCR